MKDSYIEYIRRTIIETIAEITDEEKLKYFYTVLMASLSIIPSETDPS